MVEEGQGAGAGQPQKPKPLLVKRTRFIIGCVIVFVVLSIVVPVYFYLAYERPVQKFPCDIQLSIPLENFTSYPNGSLEYSGMEYPRGYHFTVDGKTRGCQCLLRPCVRKCCAAEEVYVFTKNKPGFDCSNLTEESNFQEFPLEIYSNSSDAFNISDVEDQFSVLYGDVCTMGKFWLNPRSSPYDKNYLMSDGRIRIQGPDGKDVFFDSSSYCLENVNGSEEIFTFICAQPSESEEDKIKYTYYPVGMILSIPFLLLTFFVYALLPDLHNNLHGMSLMSHLFSMCSAYVVLSVIQIYGRNISFSWCVSLAFVIQFAFLATFFWLNVMCFDIWWVFSGLRPLQGSVKDREHKKFIFYSLYAWGGPLVIFTISLCMELIPSIPDSFIKPHFGVDKCWFKDYNALVLYFYLPIAVLVLLNIVMFVTTAIRLRSHTKETKVLKGSESRRNDDAERQRFNLYLKLFIVMGINWVMELVSFAIGGPKSIWFVTDISNTLQGLLIFLIFVWKRRVLRLLNQRLCPRWDLVAATSTSVRSKTDKLDTAKTNVSNNK